MRTDQLESCNLIPPQAGGGLGGRPCLAAEGASELFKADSVYARRPTAGDVKKPCPFIQTLPV